MNKKVWWILGGLIVLAMLAINMPNMGVNRIQKTLESHDVWEGTIKSEDASFEEQKLYLKTEKDRVWIGTSFKDAKYKEDEGLYQIVEYVDNEHFRILWSDKDSETSTYSGGMHFKIDKISRDEITVTLLDYKGTALKYSMEFRPYTGNGEENESRRESERQESRRNDYSRSYSEDD